MKCSEGKKAEKTLKKSGNRSTWGEKEQTLHIGRKRHSKQRLREGKPVKNGKQNIGHGVFVCSDKYMLD